MKNLSHNPQSVLTQYTDLTELKTSILETTSTDQEKIKAVYGDSFKNWGDLKIFQGDFINFGYWRHIPLTESPITLKQRIESSSALYSQVAKYLNVQSFDHVLEVGCGRGVGILQMYQTYFPQKIVGIDITPKQIERAKIHRDQYFYNAEHIDFMNEDAEKTSFPDAYFDKIYSVEVIQHLSSISKFALEMRRILKEKGRLVVTTFIPTGKGVSHNAEKPLPFVEEHLHNPTPFHLVKQAFLDAGFLRIDVHNLGEYIFPGFIKWAQQVTAENECTYDYLSAFKEGRLEYYMIVMS